MLPEVRHSKCTISILECCHNGVFIVKIGLCQKVSLQIEHSTGDLEFLLRKPAIWVDFTYHDNLTALLSQKFCRFFVDIASNSSDLEDF
jgi:hypothetical protein